LASREQNKEAKIRGRFSAAVRRRDAGRAEVEAANDEIGKLFARAIVAELGIVKELSEEAGVSRTTAYAMAKHPSAPSDHESC
jgi:hypothetical protein